MKSPHFELPRLVSKEYERAIRLIIDRVLVPKQPGQTLDSWLNLLARNTYRRDVQDAVFTLSERMVHWVNIRNARTWREAAARSMQSQKLHGLLVKEMSGPVGGRVQQLIRENARLISSIPLDAAETLNREVTKAAQNGARPETIAKAVRARYPKLLRSRVNLIARTETQKASAALTQSRAEYLNLPCYIWRTSEDVRVRKSHKKMDGVVCFYNDPPNPELIIGEKSTLGAYNAGECPNCRCTQIVVLHADDLKFPIRICMHNSIKSINKTEFKRLVLAYAA